MKRINRNDKVDGGEVEVNKEEEEDDEGKSSMIGIRII